MVKGSKLAESLSLTKYLCTLQNKGSAAQQHLCSAADPLLIAVLVPS